MKLRKPAACFLSLLLLSFACVAQLAQGERDRALSALYSSEKQLLVATSNLSPAQLNWKSAPDRWSIAQVTEHLAKAEDGMYATIAAQILKSPLDQEPLDKDLDKVMNRILTTGSDRTKKAKSPDAFQPANTFHTFRATLAHFEESRARTID